jgi:hypothetical protein
MRLRLAPRRTCEVFLAESQMMTIVLSIRVHAASVYPKLPSLILAEIATAYTRALSWLF